MSEAGLTATVMVPTTGDRGPLLPLSVGSILEQSVKDLEVFVMGDGVDNGTRAVIRDLAARDSRVRFFDNPKDSRRGERYRHAALGEAQGRIVCYLTDRDLMMPHHVATMAGLLEDADFAHTLRYKVGEDWNLKFKPWLNFSLPENRKRAAAVRNLVPLSCAGHTLELYHRLPYGWRSTPEGTPTDTYMWRQILCETSCTVSSSTMPTIIYLKRGDYPGWPVEHRLPELQAWKSRLENPEFVAEFVERVRDEALRNREDLAWQLRDVREERDRLKTVSGWLRAAMGSMARKLI